MQRPQAPTCPTHSSPIQSLCCSNNCPSPMPVCPSCRPLHSSHEDKLIEAVNFLPAIYSVLEHQNARDVQVLRENDVLLCEIGRFRGMFGDREKELLGGLMRKFETQKNDILRKVKHEKEKSDNAVVKYFDKLSEKGLINYRILFSSQPGIQAFYSAYHQYCQISTISCHIKPQLLPPPHEQDDQELEDRVRRCMGSTLTQSIMNFIKLKISKRDAMKISCAAVVGGNGSSVVRRGVGMPPLSPTKKGRKTQVNIGQL